jgi:hypothetical protein
MSGQKRLRNAMASKRVIAQPSRKVKRFVTDEHGNVQLDSNGKAIEKEVQLYNIYKLN